ncbi:MAG: acyl-CoA dehydrogenase [SAR324 cluster bacterium]|nr:acyl-CoA dehydrogenase [SAR324 cluster bacterium]
MSDVNFFKADLKELEFTLFEQFRLTDLFSSPPFDHFSEEDARMILKEAHHFASEVIGPTLQSSDRTGVQITEDGVKVPPEMHELWKQYYEGGWNTLSMSEEAGGQGAPNLLGIAVTEMMSGANTAFQMYPALTNGAANVIRAFGTPEQREIYSAKLDNGTWGGTMVLTESHAGSDVGLSSTKAVPNSNGSYKITGNKIFISGGDHDITENIVHLVLARIEGSPKGTRGLSLFIVPKFKVNPDGSLGEFNDVTCTSIEHKMGIHGSATAALAFGEAGNCEGYLLGGEREESAEPGEGIRKMFLMMNGARIGVGVQSLAVASTAYLNALSYARTRKQGAHFRDGRPESGAVPIIEHPDVRRMLMEMKSTVEGCRALIFFTVRLMDEATTLSKSDREAADALTDYFGLFIPLAKSFVSDMAVHVSSLALQVYGGAGYTADYPAEQYMRDSRIFPVYEGTNGIQALDLVGRKLTQNGGAVIGRFTGEMAEFVKALGGHKGYEAESAALGRAMEGFNVVLGKYMEFFAQNKRELVLLTATRFLESMSKTLIAKLLLEGALTAEEGLKNAAEDSQDAQYYQGKIATARFYARNILPTVFSLNEVLAEGDLSAMEIPDSGFSLAF